MLETPDAQNPLGLNGLGSSGDGDRGGIGGARAGERDVVPASEDERVPELIPVSPDVFPTRWRPLVQDALRLNGLGASARERDRGRTGGRSLGGGDVVGADEHQPRACVTSCCRRCCPPSRPRRRGRPASATDWAATDRSMRWPVLEETVIPPPTPVIVTVPDVYVVFEAASPPTNVCVSGWTVCEAENWNA